jgi:hypothetical protein
MTGFASKRAMAGHVAYTTKMTWYDYLRKIEARGREKYGWADSNNVKSDCMDLMQQIFPGKYTLEWKQTHPNEFHLVPVFADPKHETLWKLQNES